MADQLAERLRAEWHRDVSPWATETSADEVFADVVARYGEPHRRYHTLAHVAATLRAADALLDAVDASDPVAVRLAVWYHDSVYDPAATDNEDRSSVLAAAHLSALGLPSAVVTECARLVQATAHHRVQGYDPNATVVIDADLAVLASSPARYRRYVEAVRAEYEHLDDDAFRRGRRSVLSALLARRHLFASHQFRTEREPRARANLQAELDSWQPEPASGATTAP